MVYLFPTPPYVIFFYFHDSITVVNYADNITSFVTFFISFIISQWLATLVLPHLTLVAKKKEITNKINRSLSWVDAQDFNSNYINLSSDERQVLISVNHPAGGNTDDKTTISENKNEIVGTVHSFINLLLYFQDHINSLCLKYKSKF